jgi:hypothetical protein
MVGSGRKVRRFALWACVVQCDADGWLHLRVRQVRCVLAKRRVRGRDALVVSALWASCADVGLGWSAGRRCVGGSVVRAPFTQRRADLVVR